MIIYYNFHSKINAVDMETATTTVATELLPSTIVSAKQLETEACRIASAAFRFDAISESSETRSLIEHTTETALSQYLLIK